jgi:ADP-ribose pyrophosphatase YjhB (NUDIX family)
MSYIQELRKYIGHKPLIMVGAGVIILNPLNRLLLLHRTDNAAWGIPGGAMEPGESLEATAIRETLEETGLAVYDLDLFGAFSGPEFFYKYPNGDQVYNVTIIYLVRNYSGEPRLDSQEHDQADFFDLVKLPFPISPPVQPVLHELINSKQRR